MKRLCLDLGTTTGFAVGNKDHCVSGVWRLKPKRFESDGMKFIKLRQELSEINSAYRLELVLYEEVRRHMSTDAAHAYGGFLATLQGWCHDNGVQYSGVPVQTIKQHWTGKGNASKNDMMEEAVRRGLAPEDDNEADARALFDWSLTEYGK